MNSNLFYSTCFVDLLTGHPSSVIVKSTRMIMVKIVKAVWIEKYTIREGFTPT